MTTLKGNYYSYLFLAWSLLLKKFSIIHIGYSTLKFAETFHIKYITWSLQLYEVESIIIEWRKWLEFGSLFQIMFLSSHPTCLKWNVKIMYDIKEFLFHTFVYFEHVCMLGEIVCLWFSSNVFYSRQGSQRKKIHILILKIRRH